MALPIDFITRTRALLGEEFDRLEAALSADVPVSIRINPMKGTPAPKAGAPVAWCESGFYLPERLSFTFDPLFHAGAWYVAWIYAPPRVASPRIWRAYCRMEAC